MRITLALLCAILFFCSSEAQSKKKQIIQLTAKLDSVLASSDSLLALLEDERMRVDSLEDELYEANRSLGKQSREVRKLNRRLARYIESEEQEKKKAAVGPVSLYDAKVLMVKETEEKNQKIEEYKTIMMRGQLYYMFLTRTEDNRFCISRISEYASEIKSKGCGLYEATMIEWRNL